jgi:hypothetical protein
MLVRMGVVRTGNGNGQPRTQNRHVVRKQTSSESSGTDGVPEVIEGRPTERVDSRVLLTKLEAELNGRASSSSENLEVEVTTVRHRPESEPPIVTKVHKVIPSKMAAPSKLAHTMRRAGAQLTPPQGVPPKVPAKGSAPIIEPLKPTVPMETPPALLAEGSGTLEPMSGPVAIPQHMHEQTTEPAPAFQQVFDASKLIEPLRRHNERVAALDVEERPIRPREIVLGLLLGLTIVAGAWLTIVSLL